MKLGRDSSLVCAVRSEDVHRHRWDMLHIALILLKYLVKAAKYLIFSTKMTQAITTEVNESI